MLSVPTLYCVVFQVHWPFPAVGKDLGHDAAASRLHKQFAESFLPVLCELES